jgi:hypothetical protein
MRRKRRIPSFDFNDLGCGAREDVVVAPDGDEDAIDFGHHIGAGVGGDELPVLRFREHVQLIGFLILPGRVDKYRAKLASYGVSVNITWLARHSTQWQDRFACLVSAMGKVHREQVRESLAPTRS